LGYLVKKQPAEQLDQCISSGALEALFCQHGWLSEASDDLRLRLFSGARPLRIAKGERIFARGDSPGGIYGLISGGIGMEASAQGHPMRIGHVVRRGFWFGEGPVLVGAARYLGAVAVEDSLVIHLPLPFLETVLQEFPDMRILLGKHAQANNMVTVWVACDLLIPEAPRRIAAVLLRVTGVLDGVTPEHFHGFPLNQSLIGELANASRVHVNRVLRQLAHKGLITKHYNHLQVINPEGLACFAYGED
jgi:CRP/FNR family transcriptional regulator, cyclic AMP receptor protein